MVRLSIAHDRGMAYVTGLDSDDARKEAIRYCEEHGILNARIERAAFRQTRVSVQPTRAYNGR